MCNLMNVLLFGVVVSLLVVVVDRDGEYCLNELQSIDVGYCKVWQNLVEDESCLFDWVMNFLGIVMLMYVVDDQGDKYLVGGFCEKFDCKGQCLLVVFDWDKSYVYGFYVQVFEGLLQDKLLSKYVSFCWLGKLELVVQKIFDE